MLQVNGAHIQAAIITVTRLSFWGDMVHFHDLIALNGLEMNVETPEAMQVFKDFVGGFAQGFAVMLLVTQGQ